MKKIKKTLLRTLKNEMLIDPKNINTNQSFADYIAINQLEFNLLLYYVERNLSMDIADEKVSINQNIDEFVSTLYHIKADLKFRTKKL